MTTNIITMTPHPTDMGVSEMQKLLKPENYTVVGSRTYTKAEVTGNQYPYMVELTYTALTKDIISAVNSLQRGTDIPPVFFSKKQGMKDIKVVPFEKITKHLLSLKVVIMVAIWHKRLVLMAEVFLNETKDNNDSIFVIHLV